MENTQLQETVDAGKPQPITDVQAEKAIEVTPIEPQQEVYTEFQEYVEEEIPSNVGTQLKLLENPEELKLYKIGDTIDTSNYNSAVQIIEVLIKSKSLPKGVSSVERAFAILQYGTDLGLTPMQSFHHIVRVGQNYNPDATALAICLRHNKVGTRVLKDCHWLYADGEDFPINNRWKDNPTFVKEQPISQTNMPKIMIQPIDRFTEMEYWYKDSILNDVVRGTVRVYWSDIPDDKKKLSTYQYYAKDMFVHKCKAKIAKQLGFLAYSDALEMKEFLNEPIEKSDFVES